MKIFHQAVIFIGLLILSFSSSAEKLDTLIAMMSQKLGNYQTLNEAVVRGGLRIRLCQYCHGKDGNSVKADVPNLAAQNPVYLLTQFEYFRTGTRKNKVMNELAKNLSADERINIALYYASQDAKIAAGITNKNSALYAQGEKIYKNICANCHGLKGHGEQTLPRIASQKIKFLISTLTAYKNNKHIRPDSPMLAVTAGLSENDLMSVATYVAAMK